jgi:hypothetical protein
VNCSEVCWAPRSWCPRSATCSRYLPAEEGLSVGGDWYQTVRLGDWQLRHRRGRRTRARAHGRDRHGTAPQRNSAACALTADSAAGALEVLDRYAAELPGATSTTVVYAIVNVVDHWLEYSSAGHPYPVYVSPDGDVTFLEDAPGTSTRLWRVDQANRKAHRVSPPVRRSSCTATGSSSADASRSPSASNE